MVNNNAEFAIYSQKINLMTGKPWRNFEIAVEICKRTMSTCDAYLKFENYAAFSGGSKHEKVNEIGESDSSANVKKTKQFDN